MQFRGGMNELMRQAARMKRKIDEAKEKLKEHEVVAEAMGGKVKATVSYTRQLKRIEIDPEMLKGEDLELALAGVCAAVNQAIELADKAMEAELEKVTGGVKVPGLV